jgi:hypothetical protein
MFPDHTEEVVCFEVIPSQHMPDTLMSCIGSRQALRVAFGCPATARIRTYL